MNFASYIEKSGQAVPDKTCVVQDDLQLTFGQMEERANRLAWAFTAMGVKPGDRVAILQTNCYQFCEMLYAVGKTSGIFVNLNFRLREEEISYILNNSNPSVLIVGDRYADLIQDIRPHLPSIAHFVVLGQPRSDIVAYEPLLSRQSPDPFPCHSVQEDDTACLIYTSGTTGYPKGAMITHANITTPLTDRYTIGKGTLLLNVPMYHIAGVVSTMFLQIADGIGSFHGWFPLCSRDPGPLWNLRRKTSAPWRHRLTAPLPCRTKLLTRAEELLKAELHGSRLA